ncbi:MAG: DNA translocase FtsK 4TM domain-containing protein, partial [Novosphingobium sp.]|nr:DNA translocase FtsK 4TM domain-containing protein [Novosphingobium sp.]
MATQPLASGRRRVAKPNWRAVLRRSLRRAGELSGAALLFAAMIYLALALVSYHQTDPSISTAAGGEVQNWMGPAGAWVSERALFLFGPVSVLLLPLLYVLARKLWRLAEEEDEGLEASDQRWWRPIGVLIFAMALLSTVLSLTFTQPGGSLPASMGGITGLLGAKAIHAFAGLLPEAAQGWTILGVALVCLVSGAVLAGRVFAIEWAMLLTLPGRLRGAPKLPVPSSLPFVPAREKKPKEARPTVAEEAPRKPPEIVDPTKPAKQAQLSARSRQGDLFDEYELPELELLAEPLPNSQKKIDKLSLERNARLLETVLDDFNVKGEITAVRTGPVVTMYEL